MSGHDAIVEPQRVTVAARVLNDDPAVEWFISLILFSEMNTDDTSPFSSRSRVAERAVLADVTQAA